MGVKESRRSWPWSRVWDAVAVAAIAFALWKIFVAPRRFAPPSAHPAPHATFARLKGEPFRVTQGRGQVLFLAFYASWCEPCKIELPMVVAWRRAHPTALVVPVDVGESAAIAGAFARRYSLGNVAVDPASSARALFGIGGFPTTVVIDRRGFIRAKWEGLNPAIGLALSHAEQTL